MKAKEMFEKLGYEQFNYSIVKVYKPTYDLVFDREDNKVKYK